MSKRHEKRSRSGFDAGTKAGTHAVLKSSALCKTCGIAQRPAKECFKCGNPLEAK